MDDPPSSRAAPPAAGEEPRRRARPSASREGSPRVARKAFGRLVAVALLAILAVYVARVAGLLVTLQRAASAEAGLAAEVQALETEASALETASAEAEGDAYVERWAREEQHWAQPGDRTVVLVDEPPAAAAEDPASAGLLERLRRLFGGRDTPAPEPPPRDAVPGASAPEGVVVPGVGGEAPDAGGGASPIDEDLLGAPPELPDGP